MGETVAEKAVVVKVAYTTPKKGFAQQAISTSITFWQLRYVVLVCQFKISELLTTACDTSVGTFSGEQALD